MKKKIKAIALLSGGLDSLLAAKVVMDQGVHVEGMNFYTGFFGEGCAPVERKEDVGKIKFSPAWIADKLGIRLHVIDAVEAFKPIMLNPPHGYGANLNPCLDCKIFVVEYAKRWVAEHDFDFIVTGEVLGQRPMSQRRDTMDIVARDSAAKDILLRPLCAKLMAPTLPEVQGWVDREKLFAFSGRSRTPQIALAKQYGFEDFPQPGGGCVLTEKAYCNRLRDLWQFRSKRDYNEADIQLLKVGRHIRPAEHYKLIVGREEAENMFLMAQQERYIMLRCADCPGPIVLIDGHPTAEDVQLAARITARFGKNRTADVVAIRICKPDGSMAITEVPPLAPDALPQEWYV